MLHAMLEQLIIGDMLQVEDLLLMGDRLHDLFAL
jgi:hypothetical protein